MYKNKVYICDDHTLFIQSIEAYLNMQDKYELVGGSESVELTLGEIKKLQPDIILIDYHLRSSNGLELLEKIKKLEIVKFTFILTMRRDLNIRNKCKELGASGYLLKSMGADEMIEVFENFISGNEIFFDSLTTKPTINEKNKTLSARELEIAKLVCKEFSSDEISKMLNLSLHTVSTHRKNILKKLKVKNSIDLLMTLKETYGME